MQLDDIEGLQRIKPTRLIRCVYFLSFSGEIVYVGKSVDLYSRLSAHIEDGKVFDDVGFLEMPNATDDELLRVEKEWIRTVVPMLNVVDTPRHREAISAAKRANQPTDAAKGFLEKQKIARALETPSELWELEKHGVSKAVVARLIANGITTFDKLAENDFDCVLKIKRIGICRLLTIRDAYEKYLVSSMCVESNA